MAKDQEIIQEYFTKHYPIQKRYVYNEFLIAGLAIAFIIAFAIFLLRNVPIGVTQVSDFVTDKKRVSELNSEIDSTIQKIKDSSDIPAEEKESFIKNLLEYKKLFPKFQKNLESLEENLKSLKEFNEKDKTPIITDKEIEEILTKIEKKADIEEKIKKLDNIRKRLPAESAKIIDRITSAITNLEDIRKSFDELDTKEKIILRLAKITNWNWLWKLFAARPPKVAKDLVGDMINADPEEIRNAVKNEELSANINLEGDLTLTQDKSSLLKATFDNDGNIQIQVDGQNSKNIDEKKSNDLLENNKIKIRVIDFFKISIKKIKEDEIEIKKDENGKYLLTLYESFETYLIFKNKENTNFTILLDEAKKIKEKEKINVKVNKEQIDNLSIEDINNSEESETNQSAASKNGTNDQRDQKESQNTVSNLIESSKDKKELVEFLNFVTKDSSNYAKKAYRISYDDLKANKIKILEESQESEYLMNFYGSKTEEKKITINFRILSTDQKKEPLDNDLNGELSFVHLEMSLQEQIEKAKKTNKLQKLYEGKIVYDSTTDKISFIDIKKIENNKKEKTKKQKKGFFNIITDFLFNPKTEVPKELQNATSSNNPLELNPNKLTPEKQKELLDAAQEIINKAEKKLSLQSSNDDLGEDDPSSSIFDDDLEEDDPFSGLGDLDMINTLTEDDPLVDDLNGSSDTLSNKEKESEVNKADIKEKNKDYYLDDNLNIQEMPDTKTSFLRFKYDSNSEGILVKKLQNKKFYINDREVNENDMAEYIILTSDSPSFSKAGGSIQVIVNKGKKDKFDFTIKLPASLIKRIRENKKEKKKIITVDVSQGIQYSSLIYRNNKLNSILNEIFRVNIKTNNFYFEAETNSDIIINKPFPLITRGNLKSIKNFINVYNNRSNVYKIILENGDKIEKVNDLSKDNFTKLEDSIIFYQKSKDKGFHRGTLKLKDLNQIDKYIDVIEKYFKYDEDRLKQLISEATIDNKGESPYSDFMGAIPVKVVINDKNPNNIIAEVKEKGTISFNKIKQKIEKDPEKAKDLKEKLLDVITRPKKEETETKEADTVKEEVPIKTGFNPLKGDYFLSLNKIIENSSDLSKEIDDSNAGVIFKKSNKDNQYNGILWINNKKEIDKILDFPKLKILGKYFNISLDDYVLNEEFDIPQQYLSNYISDNKLTVEIIGDKLGKIIQKGNLKPADKANLVVKTREILTKDIGVTKDDPSYSDKKLETYKKFGIENLIGSERAVSSEEKTLTGFVRTGTKNKTMGFFIPSDLQKIKTAYTNKNYEIYYYINIDGKYLYHELNEELLAILALIKKEKRIKYKKFTNTIRIDNTDFIVNEYKLLRKIITDVDVKKLREIQNSIKTIDNISFGIGKVIVKGNNQFFAFAKTEDSKPTKKEGSNQPQKQDNKIQGQTAPTQKLNENPKEEMTDSYFNNNFDSMIINEIFKNWKK